MAQEYSQVNFRIPSKLKEDIEKAAFANNRSITSELVSRLEESFEQDQNSFDQGYEAALNHAALAIAKVLSKKNVEWPEIQKTALFMLEEAKNIKKAP
ncbi:MULTISPECIES: Arc family DNA-binding protein [unclassified Acinetobacter]|uniref:Arc family DNA-binding protein n=1 Tax=unclassified Acinetobacter TaxID=196816 RepID=UPI00211E1489|nr:MULTISPECIES: Arc family DNA-binding protein [unclassified Acinetobacter]